MGAHTTTAVAASGRRSRRNLSIDASLTQVHARHVQSVRRGVYAQRVHAPAAAAAVDGTSTNTLVRYTLEARSKRTLVDIYSCWRDYYVTQMRPFAISELSRQKHVPKFVRGGGGAVYLA